MSKLTGDFLQDVFLKYAHELNGFVRGRWSREQDVTDIIQESFLRLSQTPSPERIQNPRAFLFQTATNMVVDRHRRRQVRESYLDTDVDLETLQHQHSLETHWENHEALEQLSVWFNEMPELQRHAFVLYRTEWDATGPIDKDKTLLYRFTGSYQNNNSFRDFSFNDRMLFAPSITWRSTDATDATVELQVINQDFRADYGIPVIGTRPASIPISRSLDDPNTPKSNFNQVQLNTLFNHRFNENWAIHNRFLASFDNANQTFVNPVPAFDPTSALDQTTGIMQRNAFYEEDSADKYATNIDLTGKFNLGSTKHDVLLGFDFYRAFHNYGIRGFWIDPDPNLAINIYNPSPSYGIPQSVFDTAFMGSQRPGRDRSTFYNQWEGIYFQDQITLWDKLHIMGGGRYDWTETGRGRGFI